MARFKKAKEDKIHKTKKTVSLKKIFVIFFVLLILVGIAVFFLSRITKNAKFHTIVEETINISSDVEAYVVKNETVIETDTLRSTIPVAKESSRVSKGETIAIYKNSGYETYLKKIEQMEIEIAKKLEELPKMYSNDISVLDAQIESKVSELKGYTSSYIEMQENKNKLNELTYKKNILLSKLSPDGAKVRELIEKRDAVASESSKSADNIRATTSGVVVYKLDELENLYDYKNILTYEKESLTEMIYKINNSKKNKSGIKVIDNYGAYLVVKMKRGLEDEYITKGKTYTLIVNDNGAKINAKIEKHIQDDAYNYVIFSLVNGVENLVDSRVKSVNITWSQRTGITVPKNGIKKDETGKYVEVIKYGDYKKIYVTEVISNEYETIVKNIEGSKQFLSKYDRIIIE